MRYSALPYASLIGLLYIPGLSSRSGNETGFHGFQLQLKLVSGSIAKIVDRLD